MLCSVEALWSDNPIVKPAIPNLRWWIAGLLFLSTVINYIDRQTLSVLAPHIKREFEWTNSDFALLIISFRVAYAVGQSVCGRLVDRTGIRNGLSFAVLFYSVAAMLTSLATGLRSFCAFRFLLGAGESANWPGATKAVSEWFPRKESGWAVALFDSGSAIGGAVAPFIVYGAYRWFGDWRPVFVLTGSLGLLWIVAFRWLYHAPETHPRLAPEELRYIRQDSVLPAFRGGERPSVRALLGMRQTWGIVISKSLTDPVWFFVTDWFAIYLVSRGFNPEQSLIAFWAPFLAADIGNFAGGGLSSYLISRGWPVLRSRRFVAAISGLGMATLCGAAFLPSLPALVFCFAFSTLAYAAFSTIVLTLPADVYPSGSVATVSGLSGTGAGIGTIGATYLTGLVADRYSFTPVLIVASLVPLLAAAAVLALVREPKTAAPAS
ncbi:MAG: MFS transporter [Bryobacterales bacterium]|nr:MFS transporter [Bryobacterales bacterium]